MRQPLSTDDPRLRNGDKAMSYVLSNYLNSGFDYVFFSSVVATYGSIREGILHDITAKNFEVLGFTLTCSEDTLRERHKKRGDKGEVIFHWLHLPPYPGDTVIQTDGKNASQVAAEIRAKILNRG